MDEGDWRTWQDERPHHGQRVIVKFLLLSSEPQDVGYYYDDGADGIVEFDGGADIMEIEEYGQDTRWMPSEGE